MTGVKTALADELQEQVERVGLDQDRRSFELLGRRGVQMSGRSEMAEFCGKG